MKDLHVKKINQNLVYGWMMIVFILFISYIMEIIKGQRTVEYLIAFLLVTIQNNEHYKGGLVAEYPEFGKMNFGFIMI